MRVIVVGAGIVGVCVASSLLRDGHDVELIDQHEPGEGCSKGNAGAISPGSCIPMSTPDVLKKVPGWLLDSHGPLHIRLRHLPHLIPWLYRFIRAGHSININAAADALRSLHRASFDNYEPLVGNAQCRDLIRRTGTLAVFKTNQSLSSSNREWGLREARQIRQRRLTSAELREMVPELSPAYRHGILLPDHGYVANPHRLVQTLAQKFSVDGGKFCRDSVVGVEKSDGNVVGVCTLQGARKADRVIICAGAWSARLLSPLGIRIPLESQRGYHATVFEPNIVPPLPIVSADAKVYATPMESGLRFAGTVEFAGLDAPPDYRRADALVPLAKDMFPDLKIGKIDRWMGHRPSLPDSLPVIGNVPHHPSLLVAFGHGHHGLTGASTTAVAISALIGGHEPPLDLAPFRPDRF